jgi:hypothetical protein
VPRQKKQQRGFDDEDLAEVASWVERADHDDDDPGIKQARDAAREAEKADREWD